MTLGPDLPKPLVEARMVELGENIYIIGGYSPDGFEKEIHKFSCISDSEDCTWSTLNQQLKVGRDSAVAIAVQDNFCKLSDH